MKKNTFFYSSLSWNVKQHRVAIKQLHSYHTIMELAPIESVMLPWINITRSQSEHIICEVWN
jgi:hypothetical protein